MKIRRKREVVARRRPAGDHVVKVAPDSFRLSGVSNAQRQRPGSKPTVAKLPARLSRSVIFSFVALLIVILGVSTYSDTSQIKIVAKGDPQILLQDEEYEDKLRAILNSSLLSRNKLTINSTAVTRKILEISPELRSAKINSSIIGSAVNVELVGKDPAIKLVSGSERYAIDSDGRVIKALGQDINLLENVPEVIDNSNIPIGVGEVYISKDEVSFLSRLYQVSSTSEPKLISVSLPPLAQEAHVVYSDTPGIFVKFSTTSDLPTQLGTFRATSAYIKREGKSVKEYIDVRVEGKAYYK